MEVRQRSAQSSRLSSLGTASGSQPPHHHRIRMSQLQFASDCILNFHFLNIFLHFRSAQYMKTASPCGQYEFEMTVGWASQCCSTHTAVGAAAL
jgi:hypothetical protein